MTKKEKQEVCESVDYEGFDYTFVHQRSFDEIKDEKFHQLIKDYVSAYNALSNYIGFEKYLEKQ
jgi:hypothetical protein